MVIMGIDSSSKSCGVSVFNNEELMDTRVLEFNDTYSLAKLKRIVLAFNALFQQYNPNLVILEDPLAVRNGKITRILNQIGGAILGAAILYGFEIQTIHNKTVKRLMGIISKDDSINKVRELYGKTCGTADESDAVLIVKAFYELRTENGQSNPKTRKNRKRI